MLPTADCSPDDAWLPNQRGIQRINRALMLVRQSTTALLVICGGYNNHRGVSLAKRYLFYISTVAPNLVERVALVEGSGNHTVDDIRNSVRDIQSRDISIEEVVFVSHPIHYARVAPTFSALGITSRHEDSGEDETIYGAHDRIINAVVEKNPLLSPWMISSPASAMASVGIRAIARLQAYRHRLQCQKWARTHRMQDAIYYTDVEEVYYKWNHFD